MIVGDYVVTKKELIYSNDPSLRTFVEGTRAAFMGYDGHQDLYLLRFSSGHQVWTKKEYFTTIDDVQTHLFGCGLIESKFPTDQVLTVTAENGQKVIYCNWQCMVDKT